MESVYTVGQVNNYIKGLFNQDFQLRRIYVKGEVSNCKYHTSGHIYFSLKDKTGVLSAVMFAGNRSGLKFKLEEGQNVVVLGNITVYERDGKYQLYAKEIILEGAGLLYQRFEQLKVELSEMGLFDPMYKKPIPKYALKVGICTAMTGAAIQDIINISRRRNPYVQLSLYPCLVQGEEASRSIVNGIHCLDEMNLDTIIVGRGGGSIEDLWAFNEEIVAKAIFDCNTPIISAVGHETDTTIADYVADMRAPTPSAAAELAIFDYNEFLNKLSGAKQTLSYWLQMKLENKKNLLNQYETKLQLYSPMTMLQSKKQYTSDLNEKLIDIMNQLLIDRKHKLQLYSERLKGLSPLERISKGYAYVSDSKGNALVSVSDVEIEEEVTLIIRDGKINAKVIGKEKIEGGVYHG